MKATGSLCPIEEFTIVIDMADERPVVEDHQLAPPGCCHNNYLIATLTKVQSRCMYSGCTLLLEFFIRVHLVI